MKYICNKTFKKYFFLLILELVFYSIVHVNLFAAEVGHKNDSELNPKTILNVMERVADWQLEHPSKHPLTDWTQGAYDNGMMALAGISNNSKYIDSMLAAGRNKQLAIGAEIIYG